LYFYYNKNETIRESLAFIRIAKRSNAFNGWSLSQYNRYLERLIIPSKAINHCRTARGNRVVNSNVFITEALGFLGKGFVRALLEQEPSLKVFLLVREKGGQSAAERLDAAGLGSSRMIS
jgi:hypothetical protein